MFKKSKICTIICESPLHAGSGSDLGFVDLPIQRERHTEFPKIEGSSLKGAIRESFERRPGAEIPGLGTINKNSISLVFGPEGGDDEAHAGAIAITDARLLLFPVKSMNGVYAYTTCRKVLSRFLTDYKAANPTATDLFPLPPEKSITETATITIPNQPDKVVLEEYTLGVKKDALTSKVAIWIADNYLPKDPEYSYIREKIKKDLIVLSDDDFKNFTNLSTEVITRTAIDSKTGTVKTGALFTEEYLPTESILYFLAFSTGVFNKDKGIFGVDSKPEEDLVMDYLTQGLPLVIQIGGNATIGKGLCRLKFI